MPKVIPNIELAISQDSSQKQSSEFRALASMETNSTFCMNWETKRN